MREWPLVPSRPVWWQADNVAAMVQLLEGARKSSQLDPSPAPAPATASIDLLHGAAVRVAQGRLSAAHRGKDQVLMEEVKAVDDLLRAGNLLIERLREWYGLHAPDVTRRIGDAEDLAKLVAQHGDRAAILQAIEVADEVDLGTALEPADLAVLQGFAGALQGVHSSWRAIENRIQELMQTVAPNIGAIAGPIIGARLIAIAGGLHRIGTMSSGTIQTLGAETALFRHMKEGTKPPKHGILFQHTAVFQAQRWQRGAVARALANHIALAARADGHTGNDITEMLQQSLDEDLARIRASKSKPPVRAPPARGGSPPRGKTGSYKSSASKGKPAQRGPPPGGPPRNRGKPVDKRRVPSSDGPAKPLRGGRR